MSRLAPGEAKCRPSGKATACFPRHLEDGSNLRSDRLRDTMSTSCCSLKGNKIPNKISVWIKGSLRLSHSTPKRPHCMMTNADDVVSKTRGSQIRLQFGTRVRCARRAHNQRRLQCTIDLTPIDTHCWACTHCTGHTKLTGCQVDKLTQVRHSFGRDPIEAFLSSPHANQPLLEFTTREPTVARVHHMRTNRGSSSPHANQSMHRQKTHKRSTKHPHTFAFE